MSKATAHTVEITVSDEEWTQLREMVDTLGMRTTDRAATWIIRQALRGGLTIHPLEGGERVSGAGAVTDATRLGERAD